MNRPTSPTCLPIPGATPTVSALQAITEGQSLMFYPVLGNFKTWEAASPNSTPRPRSSRPWQPCGSARTTCFSTPLAAAGSSAATTARRSRKPTWSRSSRRCRSPARASSSPTCPTSWSRRSSCRSQLRPARRRARCKRISSASSRNSVSPLRPRRRSPRKSRRNTTSLRTVI